MMKKEVEPIKLGDEIEDITVKARGICIGKIEYLDGNKAWLIQPPYAPDGSPIGTIEVEDAFAVKVGNGVYPKPKPIIGFRIGEDL